MCFVAAACRLSHSLLWGAVLAVYLCSGSLTSLEFKLLLSVTVPVRWGGSIRIKICITDFRTCLVRGTGYRLPPVGVQASTRQCGQQSRNLFTG